jgi:hypothetical protein
MPFGPTTGRTPFGPTQDRTHTAGAQAADNPKTVRESGGEIGVDVSHRGDISV